jgi:hypothetical protein
LWIPIRKNPKVLAGSESGFEKISNSDPDTALKYRNINSEKSEVKHLKDNKM